MSEWLANNWFQIFVGMSIIAGFFGYATPWLKEHKKGKWYVRLLEVVNGAVQTAQMNYQKKEKEYMDDGKIDEDELQILKLGWKQDAFGEAIDLSKDWIREFVPEFLHGAFDKFLPSLIEKYVYQNKMARKAIASGNPS